MSSPDTYRSVHGRSIATFKDRGSRFMAIVMPVKTEADVKMHLDELRKEYHDASHHCYAYRLGHAMDIYRANDDGEPSHSAGQPILNQIISAHLSDTLVVVVRYFGGTKLGIPGLINAYRTAAGLAIDTAEVIDIVVVKGYILDFAYDDTQEVMRVLSQHKVKISEQVFGERCRFRIELRLSLEDAFSSAIEGLRKESILLEPI